MFERKKFILIDSKQTNKVTLTEQQLKTMIWKLTNSYASLSDVSKHTLKEIYFFTFSRTTSSSSAFIKECF